MCDVSDAHRGYMQQKRDRRSWHAASPVLVGPNRRDVMAECSNTTQIGGQVDDGAVPGRERTGAVSTFEINR